MNCKNVTLVLLALFLSGCTTLLVNEVNRNREKDGGCELRERQTCVDLIDAAIADIAIATYVAGELIEQMPREKPLPKIDTGDVECAISETKVCSVSSGCQCEPENAREQAL